MTIPKATNKFQYVKESDIVNQLIDEMNKNNEVMARGPGHSLYRPKTEKVPEYSPNQLRALRGIKK